MERLKYIVALLDHIIRTATGFYYRPFSASWDGALEQLLGEGSLVTVNRHNAIFYYGENFFEVWVANRWYGYGWLNRVNGSDANNRTRPRFRTMYRLHQMVQAFQAKET
ncbi:hypothetical protein [Escherichia sp. E4702]|uniref:hypothetical protein n=1 Tax=Escherichia sp. E4702 TaxID=2044465 RepID=UPI001080D10F|nr:hypothetical protein [Escherichia sp. E4702]TGB75221.1 hypothetical protein CRI67_10940 [Escherichia sp. E4702]